MKNLNRALQESLRHVDAPPSSPVVIVGSTAEGMSNDESDLDLVVVCKRLRKIGERHRRDHAWLASTGRTWAAPNGSPLLETFDYLDTCYGVNVVYLTEKDVEQEAANVRDDFALASTVPDDLVSPRVDMKLVHRLLHAKPARNGAAYERIIRKIDRKKFNFVCYTAELLRWHEFKDIRGFWRAGDELAAALCARDYAAGHFAALLCLHGYTNPSRKWWPELAKRLRGPLQKYARTHLRLAGAALSDRESCRRFVRAAMGFVDKVDAAARRAIERERSYPNDEKFLRAVRRMPYAPRARTSPQAADEFEWNLNHYSASRKSSFAMLSGPRR